FSGQVELKKQGKMKDIKPQGLSDTFEQEEFYGLGDLNPLMERIGDSHHVLLGEATHGSHEFYTWRTAITKKLILEKGFSFLAVEGDWPDCYQINRYIKGYKDPEMTASRLLGKFDRWPTWMWANWEIISLMDWLKKYNQEMPSHKKVGF